MDVIIIASRSCRHRPILERELEMLGVPYTVQFIEDHPEWKAQYNIRQSPNLLVDGQIVFRKSTGKPLPSREELARLFAS